MQKFLNSMKILGTIAKFATVLIIILKGVQYVWDEIKSQFPEVEQSETKTTSL